MFLSHFNVFCNLLLNRRTAIWNLFVFYIITQVILGFWSVHAYDLLEDRRTIDVVITIITKLFCGRKGRKSEMAESLVNVNNILRDDDFGREKDQWTDEFERFQGQLFPFKVARWAEGDQRFCLNMEKKDQFCEIALMERG